MISADLYRYIYLLLILFFTVIYTKENRNFRLNVNDIGNVRDSNFISLLLLVIIVLFVGLRPNSGLFSDMPGYVSLYEKQAQSGYIWDTETLVPVFDNIIVPCLARISINSSVFITFIDAIYFGFIYLAIRKFFRNSFTIGFLVYLAAFSTFSFGVNGMRAGMAASFFLFALAWHEKKFLSIFFVLLSAGTHQSMWAVAGCYLLATLNTQKIKIYYVIWALCLLMSLFHVKSFQEYFAVLIDEHDSYYLTVDATSSEWKDIIRFRYDLVIYSIVPIIFSYYMIFKRNYISKTYQLLSSTYILANCFWLICMYAAYTNRIAYLSWFIYPVVLIYPLLDRPLLDRQDSITRKVIYCHLFFTLFMQVIYYG